MKQFKGIADIKKTANGGIKAKRRGEIHQMGIGYKTSKEEQKILRERNAKILAEHEAKILAKYVK